MKKKELSIGDYVYGIEIEGGEEEQGSLKFHYPIQIETIYGDTIMDNYGMERGIEEDIEPMPLTVEILVQNGFEKKGHRYGIYDDYFDFEMYEYNDGTWLVSYHCCEMSLPDEQVLLFHVHQLQHFMRHCGIEKEISIKLDED